MKKKIGKNTYRKQKKQENTQEKKDRKKLEKNINSQLHLTPFCMQSFIKMSTKKM